MMKVSSACLVTGGGAESRRRYAEQAAAACLCVGERPPCGRCGPCEKVAKGVHPDVFTLSPAKGKKEISVGDARAMRADVFVRPNEGKRKIYIIDPADALNAAAQNALLKVLEDGPDYAVFLLLCEQPGRLLDTVRSRCETISLPPERPVIDPELEAQAEELARLLLHGSEWEVAQHLTALETKKPKNDQLLSLLAATEEAVRPELAQNQRAVRVLQLLKTCRENAIYNLGVGHILGWLCAELFR